MSGQAGRRRSLRSVSVEVVLFLAVLVAAPFEHHDLACHLKSPFHCTACASAQDGLEQTHVGADVDTPGLADAGKVIPCQPRPDGAVFVVRSSGRSPPSPANA